MLIKKSMKISVVGWKYRMYQVNISFFYTDGCLPAIQWMTKLKHIDCLTQCASSSVLNGTLSRQFFPSKMKHW